MIEEMKQLSREKGDHEFTHEEAYDAALNLSNFAKLIFDMAMERTRKKDRLKKESGGFPVDGHYNCLVCGYLIDEKNGWYDWYGQTCLTCRSAIKSGIIPTFVCQEHESYYSMWHLKDKFKIHPATARKMIRLGTLKARIVLTADGKPHTYIFLKKENPALICRKNPEWKSYNRHKEKIGKISVIKAADKWAREMKIGKYKPKIKKNY